MIASAKPKESRKHKRKERKLCVDNSKSNTPQNSKDFDPHKVDSIRPSLEEKIILEECSEENKEPILENTKNTDKSVITSAFTKEETNSERDCSEFLLEDRDALDASLMLELDNDSKSNSYPNELYCENLDPLESAEEENCCNVESESLDNQTKAPDYIKLLDEVKKFTLLESIVEPSAPDFTSSAEEIQESYNNTPRMLPNNDAVEVKCIKKEVNTIELKHELEQQNFKPLSEEELSQFYYNSELNQTKDFIDDFIKEEGNHGAKALHPFYELLSNYLKSENSLQNNRLKLKDLNERFDKYINQTWTVSNDVEIHKFGKCADGNSIEFRQKYMQAKFNLEVFEKLKCTISEIRSVLFECFKSDSFNSLRYKLKIEQYIGSLLTSCKEFTALNDSSSISLVQVSSDSYFQQCLSDLRISIGILFLFQRKQKVDMCCSFLQETRQWLTNLISVLLRTGNWKDHLYILNHILRCPGGVGKWASGFIQFPTSNLCDPFSNPIINHMMTVLYILLRPIEQREDFMIEWNAGGAPEENSWVLIDSEDEDDEITPLSSPLKENDLVMLLNQIPLKELFTAILGLTDGKIDHHAITANHLMKLFSFSSDFIKILYTGLQIYSTQRYKQFAKRLGRLIRHIIEYTTDELELFLSKEREIDAETLERIQVEYDNFFLKSTKTIYSSRIHGTWQYLTVLPYHRASRSVILKLYTTLQLNEIDDETVLKIELTDFEEKFYQLPESEQFYLLSTFMSMALARNLSELEFIKVVVHQLFYIGFLSNLTKDKCYKNVKSLLHNICSMHSILMSEILRIQNENFIFNENYDQSLSVFLWKELPVKAWKPTSEDLQILSSWLLKPVESIQSVLARIILKWLNYGIEEGELFLPVQIHQTIAHIILKADLEAFKKEEANYMKNVSSFVGLQEPEQALNSWSWNILLKLRLHLFDQSPATIRNSIFNLNETLKNIPEIIYNRELHELVERRHPIACFIALMTTTLGHSVPVIFNEGFALVESLIRMKKSEAAIACIEYITLMFLECPDSLYKCQYFTSVLSQLVNADYSYLKLGKNLKPFETPGPILICLDNMIQNQISSCDELGIGRTRLIEMWIKSLTKLPLWIQESGVIHLLDSLCRNAYVDKSSSMAVGHIFTNLLSETSSPAESKSSLASLLNWMNVKYTVPTFLPRGCNGNAVWFFFKAAEIEEDVYESSNLLWNELLKELYSTSDKKTNVDKCLKKACNNLQIPARTSEILTIYRLCYQILETKITHPMIIPLWQKFFLLYFHRVPGTVDNGSVGEKFFHGILNQNLFKRLKYHLKESSDCFSELHKQCNESDQRRDHYLRCSEIFCVFQMWLKEPKLHEPHLNPHLLPPKYYPALLGTIIEQNKTIWWDFVDHDQVQKEINKCVLTWQELKGRKIKSFPAKSPTVLSEKSLIDKIQEGLTRYEIPLPAPGIRKEKFSLAASVGDVLLRPDFVSGYLKPSFRSILEYADYYTHDMGEYVGLSCDLQDLVRLLYKTKKSSVTLRKTCDGCEKVFNGDRIFFLCLGPAAVTLSFEESEIDKKNFDLFNQCLRNFNQNLQRSLLRLQLNLGLSVVTIEKAIEQLKAEYIFMKTHGGDDKLISNLRRAGTELFYDLVESWSESVSFTPPVTALFEDCIDALGKTFIAENASECDSLLATINEHPRLIEKLQAYLNPNVCSAQNFIELYCKVKKSPSETRLVLLSRFDVDEWLTAKRPRFAERSLLISEVSSGLKSYGSCPSDNLELIKLFNSHLQRLLMYDFPEHYGEILNLLLEGSESQAIPVSTWFTFLNSIVPEGIYFTEGKYDRNIFEPGQSVKKLKFSFTHYATDQKLLSLANIRETMIHLANTFKTDRLKHGLYGLYPKYRFYIEPILIFCGLLSHSYVAETLKLDLGSLSVRIADQLWPLLRDLYSPWLVPYWSKQEKSQTARWIQELTDDKCVLLPWIQSDLSLASYCCSIFIDSIRFVLDTLPGVNSILSHVWFFYVTNYARVQIKDHILHVIHKYLLHLPWCTFLPNMQDIELMVKVVEHFVPMAHSLLGNIFVEVKWTDIVKQHLTDCDAETSAKLHVCLLHLLVKLPCEPSLKQNNEIVLLLSEAKNFSWHLVDSVSYDYVLNWFVMSCDPRIVLTDSEHYKLDSLIFQLLRICAGFSEMSVEFHPTTLTKRLMYVRANNKWLTTANSRFKCKDSPLFKSAVIRILNEIENTVNISMTDSEKPSELATLLSEFLNIFKEEELTPILEEVIINWLESKRSSILIYGLLRSIAQSAISPSVFGNIADACLNCYFESHDNCSWSDINSRFIMYASGQSGLQKVLISNGNLLTFYATLTKQCNDNTNLLQEKIVINDIFQSLTLAKRGESIEPKLVLIIIHAFRIADTVREFDEAECISILCRLSAYLNSITNDKGNGILSTFSLRKRECFSTRFKFVCLVARGGIMAFFQTQYPAQEDKIDEKTIRSLEQACMNRYCQDLGPHVNVAVDEVKKVESIEEIIRILRNLGLQIFNKNYLK